MIFLSKDGQDPYINMFAHGCGCSVTNTDDFNYDDSNMPIVLRGILKHKIMKRCWKDDRTFYYMDTGYFGNEINASNPNGWKYWHRIVKNNLQHGDVVIKRPADRWEKLNQKICPWKKHGRKILIAAPDEKPCKFYDVDLDEWLKKTVEEIKQYTDRPVEIRQRDKSRINRTISNTLKQALDDDVFALVTFNSNAATEAVLYGIPAFVLAPVSAAAPVSSKDLSKIESPLYPSKDQIFDWACHLAYGQFHISELKSGKAKDMLLNE